MPDRTAATISNEQGTKQPHALEQTMTFISYETSKITLNQQLLRYVFGKPLCAIKFSGLRFFQDSSFERLWYSLSLSSLKKSETDLTEISQKRQRKLTIQEPQRRSNTYGYSPNIGQVFQAEIVVLGVPSCAEIHWTIVYKIFDYNAKPLLLVLCEQIEAGSKRNFQLPSLRKKSPFVWS